MQPVTLKDCCTLGICWTLAHMERLAWYLIITKPFSIASILLTKMSLGDDMIAFRVFLEQDYQSLRLAGQGVNAFWTSRTQNRLLVGYSCLATKLGLSCVTVAHSRRDCRAIHQWCTILHGSHGAIGWAVTEAGDNLDYTQLSLYMDTIYIQKNLDSLMRCRIHDPAPTHITATAITATQCSAAIAVPRYGTPSQSPP